MSEKQPQPHHHDTHSHETHKDGHGHGPEHVKGVTKHDNSAEHHTTEHGPDHHPETAKDRDNKIAKVQEELAKTADKHHSSGEHPVSAKKESTHNESKETTFWSNPFKYIGSKLLNFGRKIDKSIDNGLSWWNGMITSLGNNNSKKSKDTSHH